LNSIGFGSKIDIFTENAIDGSMLVTLTENDLKNDIGLSNLQARKFMLSLDFAKSLADSGGGGGAELAALREENAKLKAQIEQLKMINKDLHEKLAGSAPPPQQRAPAPAPPHAPAPAPHKSGGGEVIKGAGGGALKGATLGAIGGAIAGDPAKGAKMGAAMGAAGGGMSGLAARRQRRLR
jgi:SAM domain (Sterile alpha motif)